MTSETELETGTCSSGRASLLWGTEQVHWDYSTKCWLVGAVGAAGAERSFPSVSRNSLN